MDHTSWGQEKYLFSFETANPETRYVAECDLELEIPLPQSPKGYNCRLASWPRVSHQTEGMTGFQSCQPLAPQGDLRYLFVSRDRNPTSLCYGSLGLKNNVSGCEINN